MIIYMSALAIAGPEPMQCAKVKHISGLLQIGLREWPAIGTTHAAVCRSRAVSDHGVTAMVVVLLCVMSEADVQLVHHVVHCSAVHCMLALAVAGLEPMLVAEVNYTSGCKLAWESGLKLGPL